MMLHRHEENPELCWKPATPFKLAEGSLLTEGQGEESEL